MTTLVTVRLYAAARSAAGGLSEIHLQSGELEKILLALLTAHPDLARVLPRCSFLLDGQALYEASALIAPGSTLDVLPPFAGG